MSGFVTSDVHEDVEIQPRRLLLPSTIEIGKLILGGGGNLLFLKTRT